MGFLRIQQSRAGKSRTGYENSESLFDRFFDRNCDRVRGMGVRPRANDVARPSSNGELSADSRCNHRDSDCLASANSNEFAEIVVMRFLIRIALSSVAPAQIDLSRHHVRMQAVRPRTVLLE